jgi:hypothetical protein
MEQNLLTIPILYCIQDLRLIAGINGLQEINDGLYREQTLGVTDLKTCLSDTKRRLRTNLAWCGYHVAS